MRKLTGRFLWVGRPENGPDLQYATGFSTPDPVVLLARGSTLDLVVSRLEQGRAIRQVPQARVWIPEQLGLAVRAQRDLGNWAAALLRHHAVRSVRVDPEFPLAVGRMLERDGVRVVLARESPLKKQRMLKGPREIAWIRRSQQAAVAGMRAAWQWIAESEIDASGRLRHGRAVLTSERVRERIREVVVSHGCIDSGTIVAGGAQGADPHEVGSGPLRAGELIVIDVFPRHLETGYWGDLTRTVLRGTPTHDQQAMYAAVRRAQRAVLHAVRAGVDGAALHRRAAESLEQSGFRTEARGDRYVGFIHGTGHGVGLEIHEAPSVGRKPVLLQSGMVVTVEPGLYYPAWGGVRIEDTVVVTDTGCRMLASCPVPPLGSTPGSRKGTPP